LRRPALVWLAGLVHALRRVAGERTIATLTALGGGIVAAASTVATALIQGTTAVGFVDLGAGGTRAGWTMGLLSTCGTLLGLMLVIGATAAVTLRTQLLARWFTVASGVLVLLSLIGAVTIGLRLRGDLHRRRHRRPARQRLDLARQPLHVAQSAARSAVSQTGSVVGRRPRSRFRFEAP
jgi:hypothetical protein